MVNPQWSPKACGVQRMNPPPPPGCREADSYLVDDVDEAVDCGQVVGDNGSISNLDALLKKSCLTLMSESMSGRTGIFFFLTENCV